jgi:hypothetical protein
LKDLLEKYFKLSIILLKNLFDKNLKSKYYFSLAFIQPYASLLAEGRTTKVFINIVFQTIFECVSQSLFL